MTARGRHWVWIGPTVLVPLLLLLIVLLVRHYRSGEERWNTFLAGDPHTGAHVFREKGCSHCHAVNGVGAQRAPDLGFQRPARTTLNQLVTEMWNHAPRMWAMMEAEQIAYPSFTPEETAHLFAYLYTARYMDEPGDAVRGRVLFSQKGCLRCHAIGGEGGKVGPDLEALGPVDTPLRWTQAMWNHAPAMEVSMRRMKMAWPRFEGKEMNDLLAYIRQIRAGSRQEFELLPADPGRGWTLFRKKACINCHAVGGEGGTTAPDLGAGRPLPATLTQVAGRMWNHSPEMWQAMRAKGIERPSFEGQEMADLIAFLYSVRYFELAGSPLIGRELFSERNCSRCHGVDARGGEFGPKLRGRGKFLAPVSLARALWAHGPRMYRRAQELGLGWPTLEESDLGHLLAFLNTAPEEPR
ncbi:MAG: c-type cytochrome [Terriglobia bacterium]